MLRFFTEHTKLWDGAVKHAQILNATPEANVYENAILLPLRKREDSPLSEYDGWHEGGVCTEHYEFITGLQRILPRRDINYGCNRAYVPDSVRFRNETVIFGGILIAHFGHTLVDCLSRMWYYAKNQDTKYKFVFLMMSGQKKAYKDFFRLAGLAESRYEIITEATQFKSVIVPDELIFTRASAGHPDWLLFFDLIKNNIKEKCEQPSFKKVYLTRTQLPSENRFEINEIYFEEFFKRRGFEIIAPEKLPLEEQINIIMNASEIVTTMGTLSHMMVFANDTTKCTFLMRNAGEIVRPQIIIDILRDYSCAYVEVNKSFLPSPHTRGVPVYMPTEYFEQYLQCENIAYDADELKIPNLGRLLEDYLKEYALNYRDPSAFRKIANYTAFDFINSLNSAFFGIKLEGLYYQKPYYPNLDKKIKKENDLLRRENEKLKKEIALIKKSSSWKLTAPLRKLKKLVKSIVRRIKR